jgi:short-subunit dehydrogenase
MTQRRSAARHPFAMAKTILVAGYGPGISNGVAEKFAKEGYQVALVGRTQSRLDEGVKALTAKGAVANAFAADFGDPTAVRATVKKVHDKLGPISAILWNCYVQAGGDLLTASDADVGSVVGIATTSLIAAVQTAHADLKEQKGAVFITNGGFGLNVEQLDKMCVEYNAMGLGLANAAKRKLAAMLHHKLKPEGIYVGEIIITATIKGSSWDQGNGNLSGARVADEYWRMMNDRKDVSVTLGAE